MADLQEIVDDLEAEIRRPISVEDRRWRLLAHSAQPDEADAVRRSSILTRETSPDVAAWLEGLGLQRARDLVDVPRNDDLGMTRRGCLPIRHGDVLLGFLWVIVGDRPLSDAERAGPRARWGGGRREPLGAPSRGRRASAAARSSSSTRCSPGRDGAAGELAATLRWPETGAYAVAVCTGDEAVAERLRRQRAAADFVWSGEHGRLAIVARDPAGPRTAAADRVGFASALAAAGATDGGVSAPFARLADAPAALRQAEIAALCARRRLRAGRRLRPARQLGADRLALDRRGPPGAARDDRRARRAPPRRPADRGARRPARARRRRGRGRARAEHAPRDALPPPQARRGGHRLRPRERRRPPARAPRPAALPAKRDNCRTRAADNRDRAASGTGGPRSRGFRSWPHRPKSAWRTSISSVRSCRSAPISPPGCPARVPSPRPGSSGACRNC